MKEQKRYSFMALSWTSLCRIETKAAAGKISIVTHEFELAARLWMVLAKDQGLLRIVKQDETHFWFYRDETVSDAEASRVDNILVLKDETKCALESCWV